LGLENSGLIPIVDGDGSRCLEGILIHKRIIEAYSREVARKQQDR